MAVAELTEAEVAAQEERLTFSEFTEMTAFEVGCHLVEKARAENAPVVIDIRTPDRTLFHAALPGASPANDIWAMRKSNVVFHFHRASMAIQLMHARKGTVIGPEIGLDPMDYADHGGSFPVRVAGAGVIAAITVSGLASAEDHGMIVSVLEGLEG
ncbi:heme-degrading domain-containing protein [Martelella alba]|uniref:Heme-degrading domain-containing protein n=1 Tax=Martelella alba TaxID=2590451 RepID=A0A506UER4_9HYPH|nr:heme-degrading domain-containing protein [Martelella alba]TPW31484.1 heme-degrading domain-containing protein [Martelella alba]